MQRYVVGFAGSRALSHVVMVEKDRPEWQKGNWNGVGGKIDIGESPRAAMDREWAEETNIELPLGNWDHFATLRGQVFTSADTFEVWFFAYNQSLEGLKALHNYGKDEIVEYVNAEVFFDGRRKTMYNIPWLLMLARAYHTGRHPAVNIYEL